VRSLQTILLALATVALLLFAPTVRAQEDDADLGEAARPVRELRDTRDKLLVFVFDVSGSMKGENLRRARESTITLIRQAARPGDRLVLYTFGAAYRTVFDKTLTSADDRQALIEQVPSRPDDGAGTNIRRPHHEALKLAEAWAPKPAAIVLLTDSFNDQPRTTDPAYADYLRYYLPGGRLDKYPDTPENRDYERLLASLRRSRTFKVYGIGVRVDESGRPIERLPDTEPSPAPRESAVPDRRPPPAPEPTPWPLIALAAAVLGAGAVGWWVFASRPTPLRITGGPSGAKDFALKGSLGVRLGGDGAGFAADAYPLPGTKEPVAQVRGARGQLQVVSPPQPAAGVRVFHNGLPLEGTVPLRYGDEIRVSVADPAGAGSPREYRLKFADPLDSSH
jgi:hypothetical protein